MDCTICLLSALPSAKKKFLQKAATKASCWTGNRESASLHLIQRIRDEAHRFAITYHRKLRGKRNLRSVLDHIEGIGPKRRQALWLKFKSIDAIKAAGVEELADTESMNYPAAQKIYDFFRMDLPEKAEVLKN